MGEWTNGTFKYTYDNTKQRIFSEFCTQSLNHVSTFPSIVLPEENFNEYIPKARLYLNASVKFYPLSKYWNYVRFGSVVLS